MLREQDGSRERYRKTDLYALGDTVRSTRCPIHGEPTIGEFAGETLVATDPCAKCEGSLAEVGDARRRGHQRARG